MSPPGARPRPMLSRARQVFRAMSYACLAALLLPLIGLEALLAAGFCTDLGDAQVSCTHEGWRSLFDTGFAAIMMSAYLGIPVLLAAAGIAFAVFDTLRVLRRRR